MNKYIYYSPELDASGLNPIIYINYKLNDWEVLWANVPGNKCKIPIFICRIGTV